MLSMDFPQTLRHGVGRKILSLFLLAGIVPVAFTALLAHHELNRNTGADVRDELHASAKAYGVDILLRLQDASGKAREISGLIARGGNIDLDTRGYLLDDFEAGWLVDTAGTSLPLFGTDEPAMITDAVDRKFLATGETQLVIRPGTGTAGILMIRDAGTNPATFVLLRLRAAKIWGPRENIPFNMDFCVALASGPKLYCTSPVGMPNISEFPALGDADGLMEWEARDVDYLGTRWQLFLAGAFKSESLEIIASQPKAYALQSTADFRRVFVPALLLVLVLVGVISFHAIGRSLTPLHWLTAAARQLAGGNLEARVRLHGKDEFGTLGRAFNDMADRLRDQIEMLEAMSRMDRMILTGASFEEVAEHVIKNVQVLTRSNAVAVVARDDQAVHQANMISCHNGEFARDAIALPKDLGNDWCQPRQVALELVDEKVAPYRQTFLDFGQKFVVIIPVVLHDDIKGILLIGSDTKLNINQGNLKRCIDLAGRFAVALSSVEREDALYRQAHYDELTGLPNRQLLKDRLENMIEQSQANETSGALLYLDLDKFKEINDVYGHSVGDIVLTQAAERIVNEVHDADVVSRLGGDEFVVLLPNVSGSGPAKTMATRLLARLTEVFSVFGVNHFVGVSIGIVMFPDDGNSVETLLKNADAAMYRAKEAGRARYEFFNVVNNDESRRKIELERDLRDAFAEKALEVFYQPQFDIDTGVIGGAEALLRWKHPVHGYISPAEFVPLAEDSQLIVEIGRWVIEQTCRDLRLILDKGLHPGPVSINVSARQLREATFISDILAALQRFDVHPGFLQLEVTETTVAQNRDSAIELLNSLRKHGVRVAIDDFGTGYSSLSYLQNMPYDVLKIDKSFVDLIGAAVQSDSICRTIIKMARELGKVSIAEGVETGEQIDFLRKAGCDLVQGFFYSEPLPLADFIAFIRKQDFHTQRRKALELIH